MHYRYIVIEGNIGAGKTTLATRIAKEYGARLVLEQFADNPFLPKFYENPDRYAFPLEMSFLSERYNQLKHELTQPELFTSFTIADYYFAKSLIFARNTLQPDEYRLYHQIYAIIYEHLPRPDLYVFLHVSTDRLLNNIKRRGRAYESGITAGYLEKIRDGYFRFFSQEKDIRFLILDTTMVDFVENQEDFRKVKKIILEKEYPAGITRITL
ncbi:MAG: deoxynucleoside kinase [Chlorobi bacterium]|nr:deoxynucleoside kinase [Chlorobiota bacterium]